MLDEPLRKLSYYSALISALAIGVAQFGLKVASINNTDLAETSADTLSAFFGTFSFVLTIYFALRLADHYLATWSESRIAGIMNSAVNQPPSGAAPENIGDKINDFLQWICKRSIFLIEAILPIVLGILAFLVTKRHIHAVFIHPYLG